ncbi:MAG TPA: isovaleryl-CoA dehydrogenase [Burkholderiaceae bacterium]
MLDKELVSNQSTPFEDVNLYRCDTALMEALGRSAPWAGGELERLGEELGKADTLALGKLANDHPPKLINFDRYGHRIDEVQFDPAWHALMALMMEHGVHAPVSHAADGSGAQSARAAKFMLFAQVENGAQCPVTMTYASVAALAGAPELARQWVPKILAPQYDPRSLPMAQKRGVLLGMGMTEKQGGSDVRTNTTFAEPVLNPFPDTPVDGGVYRLTGHKWFFSAPQSDAHLVLAQTDRESSAGLSCFFVPRYLPDGARNAIRVLRLKDKLGNRSNASSEVEFDGAYGWLVGKAGRGVATILEMGNRTRLDCVLGSAGIMRAALTHALHHARGRAAFGRPLAQQPLMQNVLADLALESEAATAFAMRLAQCYDRWDQPAEQALARLLTPAGKYWICKRGPAFGAEAMEVLGGNGYVEDAPLARLYRELPVNSIWEGSGNVMCLDLLRALGRTPDAIAALRAELALADGAGEPDPRAALQQYAQALLADLDRNEADEYGARKLAERIVLAVQSALLLRFAPSFVAAAFIVSRLQGGPGGAFGQLPAGLDCSAILARALPA